MSDKTFELLEKMYIEFNGKFDSLNKDIVKIENEMSNKFGVIFDAQDLANERLERIEKKLDKVSDKVDKHDIKIQVIEG